MKEQDYKAILSKLTIEEKASVCSGLTNWLTQPIEKHGVPAVWMADGPIGIRKEQVTGGANIMQESEPATCFPPSVTTASSWDPELIEEMGDAIGKEAKALKVTTVLGPGVNIKRSPLCGRNFEYYSEDPYLSGIMGAAWVRGVQKNDVGTSLKHYAANNQEELRMSIDTLVDERALREIYLSAFEHIVKSEKPTTVMCSYNALNGEFVSDSKRMLTNILRTEWGFDGIVMSDWGAVNDRIAGIKAGLDLQMPGNCGADDKKIVEAVKNKKLSESDLDKAALRMLKFAFECKEKEKPGYKVDLKANHRLARKVAANSAVLLKNDGALPLNKNGSVAVIGALAKKIRYQGSGSSHINTTELVSFTDAMEREGQPYSYAAGYTLKGDGYSKRLIKEAAQTAKGKDAVLVFIGLTDEYESEGYDRRHINLPDSHNILVEELLKVNENVIVVLNCGAPVKVKAWDNKVKAVLNLYLGGQAGGEAAYDVIYGAVNPSGKLAETFPLRNHDNIVSRYFPMGPRQVQHRESIYVGYRYFDATEKQVQYPFGFGLSYTTFQYSDLRLSAKQINEKEKLEVSFKIKNVGSVAGAEIAQLYVRDVESTLFRPVKELKGFKKVFLEPGEEKEVKITLDSRSFAYYNVLIKDWHVESGDFEILIGASSRDIRLKDLVNVISANPKAPIPDYRDKAPYYYNPCEKDEKITEIPKEQFEALYGGPVGDNEPYKIGEFHPNSTLLQISVSPWGKFLYKLVTVGSKIVAIGSENSQMITQSAKYVPIRAAATLTGKLSPASMEGLIDMFNRKKGGLRKFLKGRKLSKAEKARLNEVAALQQKIKEQYK